ncbi:hypothetical protein ABFY27_03645 [Akkermansia massiliensis]
MAVFSTRSAPLPPTSSLASGMSARLGRMRLASGISSMGRLPYCQPTHATVNSCSGFFLK